MQIRVQWRAMLMLYPFEKCRLMYASLVFCPIGANISPFNSPGMSVANSLDSDVSPNIKQTYKRRERKLMQFAKSIFEVAGELISKLSAGETGDGVGPSDAFTREVSEA